MSRFAARPDDSTRASRWGALPRLATAAAAALLALSFASDAAAGSLKIRTTTFGWNAQTGTTTAGGLGPLGQFPAMPLNQPIEVFFNDEIDKGSVDLANATVISVPSDVLNPLGATSSLPGGLIAPVNYSVKGTKLTITPALFYSGGTVNFGYVPGAFYYLRLKKNGVEGKGGDSLAKTILIGFRTTSEILDMASGAPRQTVKLIDSKRGGIDLPTTNPLNPKAKFDKATSAPPPRIRFRFNEVVLTSSLVNPATGISSTLRVEMDTDGDGTTQGDRILLPGRFDITQTQKRTKVEWRPLLTAIPAQRLYVITVEPLIEDLLGNTVFEETGDIGARKAYAFKTKPGGGTELPPLVEEFDDGDQKDGTATSADWANTDPGFLLNGVGGGTGLDGPFAPVSDTTLNTSVFDPDLQVNVPREYDFTTVLIPAGVRVRAVGEFGLVMRATGAVSISGIVDVAGPNAEVFPAARIAPGLPGGGIAHGGSGGAGGSVTDGQNTATALFTSPITGYANAAAVNQGLSGLSGALTDFTLDRSGGFAFTAPLDELWLQPNVGTGSTVAGASPGALIQHDHPNFHIDNVNSGLQLHVTNEFGPMTQPGLDLYQLPPPPIAKIGDPFLVGDLAGHLGSVSGRPLSFGGRSLPVTVAQTFLTLARSGGGGGGGSRGAGSAGETVAPSGTQTGSAGGAGGVGYLTGSVVSATATTLTVGGTPFAGLDLDGGANLKIDPRWIVIPDTTSSYFFEIASSTSNSVTIVPIALTRDTDADTNNDNVLDLTDVTTLGPGDTFRIEPPQVFGGSGGGGSGVHCANTTKLTPAPNLTLPTWTPGAGGGAGGGSLVIESASTIAVSASGKLLANGGAGGQTSGIVQNSASGGGGGGGGCIVLRSGSTSPFAVALVGPVDARGGVGGVGFVDGGNGGDGRVRLESIAGNMSAANFSTVTPTVTAADVGFMIPGLAPTVGQSVFLATGTLAANYTNYVVKYDALVDGSPQTGLTYDLADQQGGAEAPFEITFNDAGLTGSGDVDPATIDQVFVTDPTTLHLPFIRFRAVIEASKVIDGHTYTDVKIDRVEIHYTQT